MIQVDELVSAFRADAGAILSNEVKALKTRYAGDSPATPHTFGMHVEELKQKLDDLMNDLLDKNTDNYSAQYSALQLRLVLAYDDIVGDFLYTGFIKDDK